MSRNTANDNNYFDSAEAVVPQSRTAKNRSASRSGRSSKRAPLSSPASSRAESEQKVSASSRAKGAVGEGKPVKKGRDKVGAGAEGEAEALIHTQNNQKLRILLGIFFIVVTVALLLCLAFPFSCGTWGMGLSGLLQEWFGMAAWLIPCVTYVACVSFLNDDPEHGLNMHWALPALFLDLLLMAQRVDDCGGCVGRYLDGIMLNIVGSAGSFLLILLGFIGSLCLLWQCTAQELAKGILIVADWVRESLLLLLRKLRVLLRLAWKLIRECWHQLQRVVRCVGLHGKKRWGEIRNENRERQKLREEAKRRRETVVSIVYGEEYKDVLAPDLEPIRSQHHSFDGSGSRSGLRPDLQQLNDSLGRRFSSASVEAMPAVEPTREGRTSLRGSGSRLHRAASFEKPSVKASAVHAAPVADARPAYLPPVGVSAPVVGDSLEKWAHTARDERASSQLNPSVDATLRSVPVAEFTGNSEPLIQPIVTGDSSASHSGLAEIDVNALRTAPSLNGQSASASASRNIEDILSGTYPARVPAFGRQPQSYGGVRHLDSVSNTPEQAAGGARPGDVRGLQSVQLPEDGVQPAQTSAQNQLPAQQAEASSRSGRQAGSPSRRSWRPVYPPAGTNGAPTAKLNGTSATEAVVMKERALSSAPQAELERGFSQERSNIFNCVGPSYEAISAKVTPSASLLGGNAPTRVTAGSTKTEAPVSRRKNDAMRVWGMRRNGSAIKQEASATGTGVSESARTRARNAVAAAFGRGAVSEEDTVPAETTAPAKVTSALSDEEFEQERNRALKKLGLMPSRKRKTAAPANSTGPVAPAAEAVKPEGTDYLQNEVPKEALNIPLQENPAQEVVLAEVPVAEETPAAVLPVCETVVPLETAPAGTAQAMTECLQEPDPEPATEKPLTSEEKVEAPSVSERTDAEKQSFPTQDDYTTVEDTEAVKEEGNNGNSEAKAVMESDDFAEEGSLLGSLGSLEEQDALSFSSTSLSVTPSVAGTSLFSSDEAAPALTVPETVPVVGRVPRQASPAPVEPPQPVPGESAPLNKFYLRSAVYPEPFFGARDNGSTAAEADSVSEPRLRATTALQEEAVVPQEHSQAVPADDVNAEMQPPKVQHSPVSSVPPEEPAPAHSILVDRNEVQSRVVAHGITAGGRSWRINGAEQPAGQGAGKLSIIVPGKASKSSGQMLTSSGGRISWALPEGEGRLSTHSQVGAQMRPKVQLPDSSSLDSLSSVAPAVTDAAVVPAEAAEVPAEAGVAQAEADVPVLEQAEADKPKCDDSPAVISADDLPVAEASVPVFRREAPVPSPVPVPGPVTVQASLEESLSDSFGDYVEPVSYQLPPLSLLDLPTKVFRREAQEDKSEKIIDALAAFGVEATLANVVSGPSVTRYEITPARGVKIKTILNLEKDIALALAARSLRIEAPVPGKSVVGIEVPNDTAESVGFREIIDSDAFRGGRGLCVGLGKDITGSVRVTDLAKMPHLLIAGTTGSGKSVCMNTLILSLLYRFTPRELQMVMIDPKQVELSVYEGLPHLVTLADEDSGSSIICDPAKAAGALRQMVDLMESRYALMARHRVRKLDEYNAIADEPLPWVVVIIDELADLMMTAKDAVEKHIVRLGQKARAAGIHMLVATQRPSTDVITGLMKTNIPSRVAFAVSSGVDSGVILDQRGAEHLLGRGDMLFKAIDAFQPVRIQGAYVTNDEINRVVEFWSAQAAPENRIEIKVQEEKEPEEAAESGGNEVDEADEEMIKKALEVVVAQNGASATMLQTSLRIGYSRARRLIDKMEKAGYIGPQDGSKPRKVYYVPEEDF